MSIRPRLGAEVPELTARVARASNPAGTPAMWVRDRLDGLWADEDFASWYPRDGRPGISPAQLATVSVLQFLLDLSDRDAAEAVRCRIDFKYALGLDLDDPASTTACWAISATGCWRTGGRTGSFTWPWPG
jgi:transposase